MNILKKTFPILLIAMVLSCAPTKPVEIFQLEDKWMEALRQKDTVTISSLLASTYFLNGSESKNETRMQYLTTAVMPERRLDSIHLTNRELQVEGNIAISTGSTEYKGKWKENNFNIAVRYTNVWIRNNGKWQALATHISTK